MSNVAEKKDGGGHASRRRQDARPLVPIAGPLVVLPGGRTTIAISTGRSTMLEVARPASTMATPARARRRRQVGLDPTGAGG